MGFFQDMKINKMGRNAYDVHAQANDLQRRGRLAEAQKKYDEAHRLYGEAYEAGCRKTGILTSYAVLLMRRGEFELARELMKEAAQDTRMSEDTHFELRVNYSICLWRLGLLDQAIETIEYAGKYRKSGDYYTTLGTFMVEKAKQTGEFEATKAFLDVAMDYDDEDGATLDNCGEYHSLLALRAAQAGHVEEAAQERKLSMDFYERARKAKPAQITTLYALAKFAMEDGETARARELLDKALLHCGSHVCPVSRKDLLELKAKLD